ncbi:MAG: RNA methyltransferase [Vicinamibacterales bacterium]|nr:RNA methyltransferase [Vicinamibacterales bacterium]
MPIVAVEDPDDPRLVDYRDVPDPVLLRERGLFVAESRLVVRTLLEHARLRTRSLFVTEAALASLADVLSDRTDELPIFVGAPQFLRQIVGFKVHRGCLALGERAAPVSDSQLAPLATARRVVVLEHVGNPDNVGSIFRNATAFGAECVLLDPHCCDPLYRKAIRTSLGATLRLPYGEIMDWPHGLSRLRELGYTTVGLTLDPDATAMAAFAMAAPARVALVLGTEGAGLSDSAAAEVDCRVRIPIADGVDSLNVATASGIALYALAQGRP